MTSISQEQIEEYHRDGYLVLPAHLDAETVRELSDASSDMLLRVGPIVPENPRLQVDRIEDSFRVRQVYPLVDISPVFSRLAKDPRITEALKALYDDAPVLFEDKLNYKYPSGGTAFPMHQDYSYWTEYSERLVTVGIYLDNATIENGCVELVPRMHKDGLLPTTRVQVGMNSDHFLAPETVDPKKTVIAEGPAGTVLIFSCFAPHCSQPNVSQEPRRALFYTYNPLSDGDVYEKYSGPYRAEAENWLEEQTTNSPGR